jgi:hypothetical protein
VDNSFPGTSIAKDVLEAEQLDWTADDAFDMDACDLSSEETFAVQDVCTYAEVEIRLSDRTEELASFELMQEIGLFFGGSLRCCRICRSLDFWQTIFMHRPG